MSSLSEYLKRYTSGPGKDSDGKKKSKKKKVKDGKKGEKVGVKIVDNDAGWQKDNQETEELMDEDVDAPLVLEDIETKRQSRMDEIKTHKPYLSIGEDGSGWVTLDTVGGKKDENLKDYDDERIPSPNFSPLASFHTNPPSHDMSPPRKRRYDSLRPLRKNDDVNDANDNDLSPPRKRCTESSRDSTQGSAPPVLERKETKEYRLPSPPPDLSPPRRRRVRHDSASPSPSGNPSSFEPSPPRRDRRRVRHDSASPSPPLPSENPSALDLSPPRRGRERGGGGGRRRRHDPSSPVEKSHSPDLSPPQRRGHRHGFSSTSPPHSPHKTNREKGGERKGEEGKKGGMKFALMADGSASGLRTGKEISEDIKKKQLRDKEKFAQLEASITGQGAKTVYRNKRGKISSLEEIMLEGKSKKKELPPPEWGKGLVQKREKEEMKKFMEEEKDKPFAQYRDDPRLEKELKEKLRWGDPMAHLVKNKSIEDDALIDLSKDEEMLKSGFVIPQAIPAHSWLKRRCDFLPNRYGIKPGRHWDGVDRSNGFEQNLFKQKNEKRALEQEAYQWSVADM